MSGVARLSITAVMLLALFCVSASGSSITCNGGYAIRNFNCRLDSQSVYRIWGGQCNRVPSRSSENCEWIDANFDSATPYSFACDAAGTKAVTGSMVTHKHCNSTCCDSGSDSKEDDCKSKYSFQCCGFSGSPKFACETVQVFEQYGVIDYLVPEGKVVTQIASDVTPGRYVNFTECSIN